MITKNLDNLTNLFREYGGEFENVEIKYNEESGFYCHSLNSKKSSIISCPSSLLVKADDLDVNENGLYIKKPENYTDKIEFLNQYFEFQFGAQVVSYHIERKHQIESLSKDELSTISKIFPPELYNVNKYSDLEYAKKRIIDCHNKSFKGEAVIMPFVSFVNYHKNGSSFKASDNKVSISGKFQGEVSAKYNDDDVLRLASGYDFIADTKYIYSIPLSYQMMNGQKMIVNRNPLDADELSNGRWKPIIKQEQNSLTLSWFPLYLEGAPIYPAIVAKIVAEKAGLPAENILYNILKLNLNALVSAAFQLQESNNPFAKYLSEVAQRQLETISGLRC